MIANEKLSIDKPKKAVIHISFTRSNEKPCACVYSPAVVIQGYMLLD